MNFCEEQRGGWRMVTMGAAVVAGLWAFEARAVEVRMAREFALSPDGATLAFTWRGDVWSVPAEGGRARRLTHHEAEDGQPAFSPDGRWLAYVSQREGGRQVFVMPARGGDSRQLTRHSEGYDLMEWMPDGENLLVTVNRDFSWKRFPRANRAALLPVAGGLPERVLFDEQALETRAAADGRRFLFGREGELWWRQGYEGSRSGQVWMYSMPEEAGKAGRFTKLLMEERECRWPLWKPDGAGFYYVSGRDGCWNLWERDLASGKDKQITRYEEDSVVFPALSRDGGTLVFRRKFDLFLWRPGQEGEPKRIRINAPVEGVASPVERPLLTQATEITHTRDGLQMAFIAGGDVWVMDTELREPARVTATAEEERGPVFAPDGKTLWFVSDAGGQTDIWKASVETGKTWWESGSFKLEKVTDDDETESRIQFAPDGKSMAFVKGSGDVWMAGGDGSNARMLFEGWDAPWLSFSPDGKWLAYSVNDEWFNADVWVRPVDGSRPPFNLSRHPDNDERPVWSPDGRKIAWTGKRENGEVDVFYVFLRAEDGEQTARERRLAAAREKFKKPVSSSSSTPAAPAGAGTATAAAAKETTAGKEPAGKEPQAKGAAEPAKGAGAPAAATETAKPAAAPAAASKPAAPASTLKIDWEGIHQRVVRVSIANSTESGLVWSPDSKKLAFAATVSGKRGTYTVAVPGSQTPVFLSSTVVSGPVWLKEGDQITGLSEGKPVTLTGRGVTTTRSFRAVQTVDRAARQRAIFDQCWRVMRDRYYDGRLGNRDWDAVRAKYADMAEQAPDMRTVQDVVHLMLGELNGSHLGFALSAASSASGGWREETAHLGLRFDPGHEGPGWKVRDVIRGSPAARQASLVRAGEVVLAVDGTAVDGGTEPAAVLNGPLERDVRLRVAAADGKERLVTLRPISWTSARQLLYDQWIEQNREHVEKSSEGRLGYLHISAMDTASFHRFQEELYSAGAGREGLVIDVRENGGGSTTDHLLTALTQPRHAITVPRGGQPGYPQDRLIYATWDKPVVVLCNQNSYSNAEIFSHAIKLLGRGKLVGVPTAGGVISTGSANIMGAGTLRLPTRGWFGLESGIDMELNGALPDFLIWPEPGELSRGIDRQLNKAVEVLLADVEAWLARPRPELRKASER
jgi:tricorn protease